MANNPWRLLITATLAFFITACDKPSDTANNSDASVSSTQTQINDKFTAFIKAANSESSVTFRILPEALYQYQRETEPQLKSTQALSSYSVINPVVLHTVSEWLAKGLSLPGPIPQLDQAAQAYKATIDALLPLSETLYAYQQNKGWLNDNGELARRSNAAYLADFSALLERRDDFLTAISVANRERIKFAYENSPADSAEHYRNGMVYLSRQALYELNDEATPAETATLKQHVETLSQLSVGWDKLLQQQDNSSCKKIIDAANVYISALHSAMSAQTQGKAIVEEDIILPFNALVHALNSHRSC